MFHLGRHEQWLLKSQILSTVGANNSRPNIMGQKFLISYPKQLWVDSFSLDNFSVFDSFLSELTNDRLWPFYRWDTGYAGVILRDNGTYLLFLTQEKRNLSMVDAKTMDTAIAVTDGLGKSIVEFLVKLMIGIDPSHRQK